MTCHHIKMKKIGLYQRIGNHMIYPLSTRRHGRNVAVTNVRLSGLQLK
jgi:hypothetical protein